MPQPAFQSASSLTLTVSLLAERMWDSQGPGQEEGSHSPFLINLELLGHPEPPCGVGTDHRSRDNAAGPGPVPLCGQEQLVNWAGTCPLQGMGCGQGGARGLHRAGLW